MGSISTSYIPRLYPPRDRRSQTLVFLSTSVQGAGGVSKRYERVMWDGSKVVSNPRECESERVRVRERERERVRECVRERVYVEACVSERERECV